MSGESREEISLHEGKYHIAEIDKARGRAAGLATPTHQLLSNTMPWKPTSQYLRITFTVNLQDDKTWEDYDLETFRTRLNPSFLILGKETGDGGRKHFQGYVEFGKKRLGSAMDRCFRLTWPLPTSCHYEISSGTAEQNERYCSKEDATPFRFGEPKPGQGTRSDLAGLFTAVKEGATDVELAEMDVGKWAVHRKALAEYRQFLQPKRSWPTKLIFMWGPTGNGKTAQAQHFEPETVHYRDPFVQGYTGSSETVLFDDFDWKRMAPKYWLTLCDRYPMTIEVKGGLRNWAPKIIIFTSNDDPKTWWPEAPPATLQAIHRRMDEFGEIRQLGEPVPHTQKLLSQFFLKPASSSAGSGTRHKRTSDSEDEEEEHSQPSDYEEEQRALKRTKTIRPTEVIDLTQ